MKVKVLMFASLAQRMGVREATLELRGGATVADALKQLRAQHAALAEMGDKVATAVNMAYVRGDHALVEGDELALIPPVSGG